MIKTYLTLKILIKAAVIATQDNGAQGLPATHINLLGGRVSLWFITQTSKKRDLSFFLLDQQPPHFPQSYLNSLHSSVSLPL